MRRSVQTKAKAKCLQKKANIKIPKQTGLKVLFPYRKSLFILPTDEVQLIVLYSMGHMEKSEADPNQKD